MGSVQVGGRTRYSHIGGHAAHRPSERGHVDLGAAGLHLAETAHVWCGERVRIDEIESEIEGRGGDGRPEGPHLRRLPPLRCSCWVTWASATAVAWPSGR